VHASNLARARETADIVVGALGLDPPRIDTDLVERGFGCFEGLDGEACAARFPEAWARYRFDRRSTPPGGEPQDEVVARMLRAMAAVAGAVRPAEAALVISHGGALRSFMAAVTGNAPAPIGNGVTFRAAVVAGRFVSFEEA
jgi:probable phosphoglycerate mutase